MIHRLDLVAPNCNSWKTVPNKTILKIQFCSKADPEISVGNANLFFLTKITERLNSIFLGRGAGRSSKILQWWCCKTKPLVATFSKKFKIDVRVTLTSRNRNGWVFLKQGFLILNVLTDQAGQKKQAAVRWNGWEERWPRTESSFLSEGFSKGWGIPETLPEVSLIHLA